MRADIAAMTEIDIDILLERYLSLLDDYVNLQAKLSELHSAIFQNLAKANFSTQRGVRYGQDYYDGRMQATLRVACSDSHSPIFSIFRNEPSSAAPVDTEQTGEAQPESVRGNAEPEQVGEAHAESKGDGEKPDQPRKHSGDPLRWFGILTPMPLRQAQTLAIESVEDLIPRLATVSAKMADVELEIRRARKKRAKAEKLKRQHPERGGQTD